MNHAVRKALSVSLAVALLSGCATVPYVGQGPHPQIERGQPIPPVDAIGNVLSLPYKLLLLNWKVDNHHISPATEQVLVSYLNRRPEEMGDLKIRLNQWAPFDELERLLSNKRVAWPYRLLIGLPVTLVFEILLPGRLLGGDHYNPYTHTIHLYSDLPPLAIHEAGHAYDFAKQRLPGTYALLRFLPFVELTQEIKATDEAIGYFTETGDRANELNSYKILYPALTTYAGRYFIFPYGLAVVAIGHLAGRKMAANRREWYRRREEALQEEMGEAQNPSPRGKRF